MPERHLDEFRLYYSKQAKPAAPVDNEAAAVKQQLMAEFPQTKVIR